MKRLELGRSVIIIAMNNSDDTIVPYKIMSSGKYR